MPEFTHVPAPVFSPTWCLACMANRDANGFVDLIADINHDGKMFGRAYLCATCLYQAGQKAGMLSPDQADKLWAQNDRLTKIVADLEQQLAAERENKVISLADARRLISPRGGYTKPAA